MAFAEVWSDFDVVSSMDLKYEGGAFKIHLYMIQSSLIDEEDVQYVITLCLIPLTFSVDVSGCFTELKCPQTLWNPTLSCFPVCVVVEEILVCFDGSQPEILQGFNCRGGELICSLFHISVSNSLFVLFHVWCLCYLRPLTWMVRSTCQLAAM